MTFFKFGKYFLITKNDFPQGEIFKLQLGPNTTLVAKTKLWPHF